MRSSGTTAGATAECAGVVAAPAETVFTEVVSASVGAVCSFY